MEKLPDVNVNMLSLLNFDLSMSHAFYPGSIKSFLMKTTQQNFPVILTECLQVMILIVNCCMALDCIHQIE